MDTTKNTTNINAGYFSYYPDRRGKDGTLHIGVSQQIPTTTNCGELYRFITAQAPLPLLEQRTLEYKKVRMEQGKAQARPIKEALPTFRATGVFRYTKEQGRKAGENAHTMTSSSNLICLDFDHVADIQTAWQRIIDDGLIQPVLLFHSVSGHGIKGIFPFPEYTDKETWKYNCRAIAEHYKNITATDETTGETAPALDFDNAATLAHANSICLDKHAYYNPKADPASQQHDKETFTAAIDYIKKRAAEIKAAEPKPEPQPTTTQAKPTKAPNGANRTPDELAKYSLEKATWYADQLKARGIDITKGIKNWRTIAFALSDNSITQDQAQAIFCKVSAQHPDYDETECKKTFDKAAKDRKGQANLPKFFYLAEQALQTTYEQHLQSTKQQKPLATQSTLTTLATIATINTQATMDNNTAATTEQAQEPTQTPTQTIFRQTTLADIQAAERKANATPSLPTAFVFDNKPLTLRSSALTLIAACSSHGKTRMLENMAYYTATQDTTSLGATIFFTLEEPKRNVFLHLAAIHANAQDNRHKIDDIETALHQDSKGEKAEPDCKQALQDFNTMMQQRRLFLFDDMDTPINKPQDNDKWTYNTVQALCKDMETFAQEQPIKAIYIDHLQVLRYSGEGTRTAKNERIELILDELETLAKKLHIPVIITAQLNRSTYNGLNMTGSNIAESADTERSADTIILLWNSTYQFRNYRGEETSEDHKGTLDNELKKIGYHYTGEQDNQLLLAVLYKRRGGKRGLRTALDYNAPFATIRQHPTPTQQQTDTKKKQKKPSEMTREELSKYLDLCK